jgi:hypothetical protein
VALMPAYLVTTKNLSTFFDAIRSARAPERFTTKFLEELGLTSSNDRAFIGLLKGLRFIDDAGAPTKRYYDYLDESESRRVLASAIRDAYDDLFAINRRAEEMNVDDVRGKLKSLTQGQKSENVYNLMANTFKALTGLADWAHPPIPSKQTGSVEDSHPGKPEDSPPVPLPPAQEPRHGAKGRELELHYNIQLILPESRDPAVYDALFTSIRKHLL